MNNKSLVAAICQMQTCLEKDRNLEKARLMIARAAHQGAELVVLPEVFNGPYAPEAFSDYAENVPGQTSRLLSACAREHGIILVGGSFIEKTADGKMYNTSCVFDRQGNILGRHRKIHLFDADIPGQITFQESSTLTAGEDITVIHHEDIHMGLMTCYDARFPELARAMVLEGAELFVVPACYNRITGPVHWDLIMRSRAVDNQVFVLAAGSALNPDASYKAWGHSMILDPWGNMIAGIGDQEDIVIARLNLTELNRVRREFPMLKHRRHDLYGLEYKKPPTGGGSC